MNDFDQLLHNVLAEHANPAAPSSLESNIIGRLPGPLRKQQSAGRVRIGIAASIIFAVATWISLRTRGTPTTPLSGSAIVNPVDQPALAIPTHTAQPGPMLQAGGQRSRSTMPRKTSRRPVQIPAIAIDPLAIQPIEIALLAPGTTPARTITKGKQP